MKNMFLLLCAAGVVALSSCTLTSKSIKTPAHYVEFKKEDFTYSDPVTAEASSTKILGIDFPRLLDQKVGTIDIPIIGFNPFELINQYVGDRTVNYALYELYTQNPGYDVIFYPVIEKKTFKVLFFYSKTDAKVTARLGKLKK